jgi:hypothetical protein
MPGTYSGHLHPSILLNIPENGRRQDIFFCLLILLKTIMRILASDRFKISFFYVSSMLTTLTVNVVNSVNTNKV